jgi:hypothetical protein
MSEDSELHFSPAPDPAGCKQTPAPEVFEGPHIVENGGRAGLREPAHLAEPQSIQFGRDGRPRADRAARTARVALLAPSTDSFCV